LPGTVATVTVTQWQPQAYTLVKIAAQ
jgi:hypothetical protein